MLAEYEKRSDVAVKSTLDPNSYVPGAPRHPPSMIQIVIDGEGIFSEDILLLCDPHGLPTVPLVKATFAP